MLVLFLISCDVLQLIMEIAKIIREDFLQQNAFSSYDFTCPLYKSLGMLRCIVTLYNCSLKAITDSPANQKVGGSR